MLRRSTHNPRSPLKLTHTDRATKMLAQADTIEDDRSREEREFSLGAEIFVPVSGAE